MKNGQKKREAKASKNFKFLKISKSRGRIAPPL